MPRDALACPGCGADHQSGWREDAEIYDGLDLGDDGFNYDEFVREEFGGGKRSAALHPVWWVTAALVLAAFVIYYVVRF